MYEIYYKDECIGEFAFFKNAIDFINSLRVSNIYVEYDYVRRLYICNYKDMLFYFNSENYKILNYVMCDVDIFKIGDVM